MSNIHKPGATLVARYILHEASPAEITQVEEWASLSTENRNWLNQFKNPEWVALRLKQLEEIDLDEYISDFKQHLQEQQIQTRKAWTLLWWRVSYAAIFIIVCLGIHLYKSAFPKQAMVPTAIVKVTEKAKQQQPHNQSPVKNYTNTKPTAIHPPSASAATTKEPIPSTQSLSLPDTLNLHHDEQEAHFAYSNDNDAPPAVSGVRPLKHHFEIGARVIAENKKLPDSSLYTLNAVSGVDCPDGFTGDKRRITVNGEAYIRARRTDAFPLLLTSRMVRIETAGADFNIRSYDNEQETIITAFTGSPLLVFAGPHMATIHPRQQAVIKRGSAISINNIIQPEKVLAYTKLFFHFDNDNINMVASELAHWYKLPLVGSCSHNVDVSFIRWRKLTIEEVYNTAMTTNTKAHLKLTGNQLILQ